MATERSLLPGLQQKCVDGCPRLRPLVEHLKFINLLSDKAIQRATNPELYENMPNQFVSLIGEMKGEDLNPSIDADRARAQQVAMELSDNAYELLQKASSFLEEQARGSTNHCVGEGPLEVPVSTAYGQMIVGICQADLAEINCPHNHIRPMNIRLESPTE